MVRYSVSWLSPLFFACLEDEVMKIIVVSILVFFVICIVAILYCCLIVAKRADKAIKYISVADKDKRQADV